MSFNALLGCIEAEHERQLAELRSENHSLRQQFVQRFGTTPPEFSNITDGPAPRLFMEEKRTASHSNAAATRKETAVEEEALNRVSQDLRGLQNVVTELSVQEALNRVSQDLRGLQNVVTELSVQVQALRDEEDVMSPHMVAEHNVPTRTKMVDDGDSDLAKDQLVMPQSTSAWMAYYMKQFGQFLQSEKCEIMVGTLILLNTVVMAFEMQYQGLQSGYDIGYKDVSQPAEESWPGGEEVFPALEKAFTILFCLEVLLKIVFVRCTYIKNPLNWLDIFVVVVSVADWVLVETATSNVTEMMNPMVIRMLRLAKLARGLRMMKMSKVLDSLSLLLKCIAASLVTLFWSLCLLFVVQCIAGMIISQMVQSYLRDDTMPIAGRHQVYKYYGTFTKSMFTMFEITMANWAPAARVLVDNIDEWYSAYFLFYRCIVGFAVLGVITAVFIQQTMNTAAKDHDVMIQRKRKESEEYKRKLQALFAGMDASGDGLLSYSEFCIMLSKPDMKAWMSALDIDAADVDSLFTLMADSAGEIGFESFLQGAGRLKGQAKSLDMAKMQHQVARIEEKLMILLASPKLMPRKQRSNIAPELPNLIQIESRVPSPGQSRQSSTT